MLTLLGVVALAFNITSSPGNVSYFTPDLVATRISEKPKGLGSTCEEHITELVNGLKKKELWALQMIDSMPKIPEGILLGRFSAPGLFDECVNAVNDKFSGKHCMPKLILEGLDKPATPNNDYGESLRSSGVSKIPFKFGICVPSTCNSTDVVHLFEMAQDNVELLQNFTINITERDCSTKEFRSFRTEDWVTVAVVGVLAIIALGSTIYDVTERFINKKQIPNKLWSSFSIYTNGKSLFTISQSAQQLKCLHGIRCLSMLWVILCHCYLAVLIGPLLDALNASKYLNDKTFIPVTNGFLSVDSFFFLSGLLVCLVFFRDISRKKTFDVPVAFIHRYLRLTPPFALLLLIQSTILSRVGNGPFWNESIDFTETQCRDSWWTGLLYLQNYLKPETMCLGQAWYLSADMQMFWVSPLILYPLLWFPHLAPYFISILILAASFTNFTVAYVNNLRPNNVMNFFINPLRQFQLEYVPFHTRMAPWLVGLATGYIICGIQAKKIRLNLSKTWVIAGWAASFCLLGGSFVGIVRFVSKEPTEYSQLESSLYLAFHRVGWALGMGWVVVACVAGYGGPINTILSLDSFQVLGRLSYCNFLLHMTIQNYRVNTSRTGHYIRHFDIVYSYFGDIVISHLISIPVVLLFEFPFSNLDRHFLQNLVIFPLPKPEKEKESEEKERKEKAPVEQIVDSSSEDIEKGKVNPAFNET